MKARLFTVLVFFGLLSPLIGGGAYAHGSWLTSQAGSPISLESTIYRSNQSQPQLLSTAWVIEVADASGNVGKYPSLALDSTGRPHVVYYDITNSTLKYAYYDGSTWHIETVDSVTGAAASGGYASLALDASNRPYIGYYDDTSGELRYTYSDGLLWHIETMDTNLGPYGGHVSLKLDSVGQPHISYYDQTNGYLKYAYYDGAVWDVQTVDTVGVYGSGNSLALDTSGYPHISYTDLTNGYLEYAQYNGLTWQIEVIATGNIGPYASLALDSTGRPHIGYYDALNGYLRYSYYDGSIWHIETVDTNGDVGLFTSLGLDTTDLPHISYYDYDNQDLKYAYYDGMVWQVETVDSIGDTGRYTSLALDTTGRPHIGYYDSTNGDLKYAYIYAPPVEGLIPPSGGTLSSPFDQTQYTFPAGVFSETVRVIHVPRIPSGVPAPGSGLLGIGHFYSVTAVYSDTGGPATLVPGATYTVTIGYTDQERGSAREDTLALYRWDGDAWTLAGITSTVDVGINKVTARVGSLGLFGVLGETWRVYLPVVRQDVGR